MKHFLTITLASLVAVALLAACTEQVPQETTPELQYPVIKPTQPEETYPVYTRPAEEEEYEDGYCDPEEDNFGSTTPTTDTSSDSQDNESDDAFAGGTPSSGSQSGNSGSTTPSVTPIPSDLNGKPLSWANINSFPIKSPDMTVADMRSLCVGFFRYAKTAVWTASHSIDYVRNAKGTADSMTAGTRYGGLPYVGSSSGNIYRLMDYLDETTGVVDLADALKLTGGVLQTKDLQYFGNQCANGASVGWQRVINSVSGTATMNITEYKGYVLLGDYKYDTTKIKTWSTDYGTDECVKENGNQVMYRSYAELKVGDGLVYYTTAGHVVMAATDAHVEYVSGTNTIDGNKSYIYIIHQAQKWEDAVAADGKTYQVKDGVDVKVTFKKLFDSNYVPVTFAEFMGTDPVEKTSCSFSYTAGSATLTQLCKGKITCNYSITDAYIIVTDGSGKEVYKHAVRNSSPWGKTLQLSKTGSNVDTWGKLTSGIYNVKVVAQLGTGERPIVYSGKLTMDN